MENNMVMKWINGIAFTLLVVGGINWLLIGLFRFDLVAAIFGNISVGSRIIYSLVGISALTLLATAIVRMVRKNRIEE
jgi:uncharacterized membrane protein YuzA (DUF378 family)